MTTVPYILSDPYLRADLEALAAGSIPYPGAGIPNSTGSAWGASYGVSGTGSVVLTANPTITALKQPLTTQTANYAIVAATDFYVICTTNAFTVTLPTAVGISGQSFVIKNGNTVVSGNLITMATTSAQTIDGSAPGTITPLSSLTVVSDGSNWWIV